jgi:flagellar basal body-associated protein FliL
MSEEIKTEEGWSTIKKTIIGVITTAITAGGAYLTSTLVGGHKEESKKETKTEQTSAPAPVVINVQQNQENKQQVKQGGTNTIIKERVIEKPVAPATKPEPKDEEPW